jgi:hypothetical protein
MAEHPIYLSDPSLIASLGIKRPCAAPADEVGSCADAARTIGVHPESTWTSPNRGAYGWVCSAHERVLTEKYQPERIEAMRAQLASEGREFWDTYGEESGETPHLSRRTAELDSLNSDTQ